MTRSKIIISRARYAELMRELAERGRGDRESGAFLLATKSRKPVLGGIEITSFAFYDDVDPGSLTGGITMHAVGFTVLNNLCRERNLAVVGDVHTHPSDCVEQSDIDSSHPMMAFPGHIAVIAPRYAQGLVSPLSLGIHRFLGGGRWEHPLVGTTEPGLLVASTPRILWARIRYLLERRAAN